MEPHLEELLLELVHTLNRRMIECVQPVARLHELSHMAMFVLRIIQSSPGETVSDLARRAEIAKSHISNTVDLLGTKGFVEKRPDLQDRRLIHLYPTEKAQALGETILAEAHRSLSAVLDEVDAATVAALVDQLRVVLDAFDRHTAQAPGGARAAVTFPGDHTRR